MTKIKIICECGNEMISPEQPDEVVKIASVWALGAPRFSLMAYWFTCSHCFSSVSVIPDFPGKPGIPLIKMEG